MKTDLPCFAILHSVAVRATAVWDDRRFSQAILVCTINWKRKLVWLQVEVSAELHRPLKFLVFKRMCDFAVCRYFATMEHKRFTTLDMLHYYESSFNLLAGTSYLRLNHLLFVAHSDRDVARSTSVVVDYSADDLSLVQNVDCFAPKNMNTTIIWFAQSIYSY